MNFTQPLQRRQHPARKIYTSSTGNINVSILFRTHYICQSGRGGDTS
ncbi:hypothetical protein [uncultured Psychrobacter sp.]